MQMRPVVALLVMLKTRSLTNGMLSEALAFRSVAEEGHRVPLGSPVEAAAERFQLPEGRSAASAGGKCAIPCLPVC